MSNANKIHAEIIEVLQKALKDGDTSYADVFGAIEVTKAFFTCEYAMQLSLTWREVMKDDVNK